MKRLERENRCSLKFILFPGLKPKICITDDNLSGQFWRTRLPSNTVAFLERVTIARFRNHVD